MNYNEPRQKIEVRESALYYHDRGDADFFEFPFLFYDTCDKYVPLPFINSALNNTTMAKPA